MDWVEIEGKEIPLLEAPQSHQDAPRRILYVLFKHQRLIAVIFLAVSIPILIYILLQPTEYVATAKVLIKPSREFMNVGGDTVSLDPTPEVINLAPAPVRNSNLIQISMATDYPQEWTVRAVNRAAELYLEEHLKAHKTQGIEQFYDEQETKLRDQLMKAEEALKEFQRKENIIDAPQEVTADLTALAAFEKNLKETDSAIRETEQRIAVLDNQLKQQKATISSNTNITVNPVYQQMRARLTQLELERDSLLQRYTPEDRLVQWCRTKKKK
jgi:uncharacterized protein involved in exopolysaccharide biosynthesis